MITLYQFANSLCRQKVRGVAPTLVRDGEVVIESTLMCEYRATLADIALMPYVARLQYLDLLDLWIADRPGVQAWWRQVQDWPSYVAGITRPMIPHEADEMALHGPKVRADLADVLAEQRAA